MHAFLADGASAYQDRTEAAAGPALILEGLLEIIWGDQLFPDQDPA
jgi:hypothetical protein